MAREIVVKDDLTGESGAETHVIVVDGVGVEIDLAERSVEQLLAALKPYFEAGRFGQYQVSEHVGRRQRAATSSTNGDTPAGEKRPTNIRYNVDTAAIVAYIAKHPGKRTKELADHFKLSSGALAYRLKVERGVRSEARVVTGATGRPQQHWYPAN